MHLEPACSRYWLITLMEHLLELALVNKKEKDRWIKSWKVDLLSLLGFRT